MAQWSDHYDHSNSDPGRSSKRTDDSGSSPSKKDEKSIKNLAKCATGHKSRIPKRKRIKGETGNLSDLYTYISNRNQFPNERDYDKCYFNESSFTFHTDPAFLDPMKKPVVDLTKDVYKRNIKDDPLDIKNKDKFALEKKLA